MQEVGSVRVSECEPAIVRTPGSQASGAIFAQNKSEVAILDGDDSKGTVLITGAAGFGGSHLARADWRQPFLPSASMDFAGLTPSLTVDSALHGRDNL